MAWAFSHYTITLSHDIKNSLSVRNCPSLLYLQLNKKWRMPGGKYYHAHTIISPLVSQRPFFCALTITLIFFPLISGRYYSVYIAGGRFFFKTVTLINFSLVNFFFHCHSLPCMRHLPECPHLRYMYTYIFRDGISPIREGLQKNACMCVCLCVCVCVCARARARMCVCVCVCVLYNYLQGRDFHPSQ